MDGHDGLGHHLLNCVGRHSNDGGHIAVFEPIEVSFDRLGWVPGCSKQRIISVLFRRRWCAVHSSEGEENVAWVVVAAVHGGADDVASCWCTVLAEGFGDCHIQRRIDGPGHCGLCLPRGSFGIVGGFGVACCLGVEADWPVGAGVRRINPWRGGF